jgi:transcriptional regulator GlxA family with amidase domain
MTVHNGRESPDLSGLHVAIRLKADLLHKLGTHDPSHWMNYVLRFFAALDRSRLTDRTALVVLLTELREQLRLLASIEPLRGTPDESAPTGLTLETWIGLSRREILECFKEEIRAVLLPARSSPATWSPIVKRTKCIIDKRYADPLTLERVAEEVGRSKRQLANVFRQEIAMTLHEYLTHVRLRQALELIRNGEKIEAVSLLVGYRSKKNFYHHFKTHIGVTPLAYRAGLFRIQQPS